MDKVVLDHIFGEACQEMSAEERARTSTIGFVRSQDQLAIWSPAATGRRLTAWEALQTFGIEKLEEVIDFGSALLMANVEEPAKTLHAQRTALGLSIEEIAAAAGLNPEQIADAEDPNTRSPIRTIERMAQTLALSDSSFRPSSAQDDHELAYRLRDLRTKGKRTSAKFVSQLCEAAWVIRKQLELRCWLGKMASMDAFTPSDNYGDPDYPAWQHGYYLAHKTREILGIDSNSPIERLLHLTESELGVAVVQLELPHHVAGATVGSGNSRGIALNIVGQNENVWVRRMTLAHELGHLLWDPTETLNRLRVDEYDEIERDPYEQTDYVEQRANAFAVAFLAPPEAVSAEFRREAIASDGLRRVMEVFGLSFTTARYHIWNAESRRIALESLTVNDLLPTDDWKGRESFTSDYFQPDTVPRSRRGQFAILVEETNRKGLITDETAATYLGCSLQEYQEMGKLFIRSLAE